MIANAATLFLPRRCGGGAEQREAEGVAVAVTSFLCRRHPFRQALRACHLPRKTGEERE